MVIAGELFGKEQLPALRAQGLAVLRGLALPLERILVAEVERIAAAAPLRRMMTPGGHEMSAAMTNCGEVGWVSDRGGYRYDPVDPASGKPWPSLPRSFLELARGAASQAGLPEFRPDVCLINCYEPGARMALHQDRDERDFSAPIVSVSLGLPVIFLWGGLRRAVRPQRVLLAHGDVAVWAGAARLAYHGVAALADGHHALLGRRRVNLTLRRAR